MTDKKKIILMTKLALYDKSHGDSDRAVFSYFRSDYIYRKNLWTRLCVSLGAAIVLAVYWLHKIFIIGEDLLTIDIQQGAWDSVLFLGAVIAFYTLAGTVQGTRQYYLTQKRMTRYWNMLQHLKRVPEAEQEEEAADLYYGTTSDSARKRH